MFYTKDLIKYKIKNLSQMVYEWLVLTVMSVKQPLLCYYLEIYSKTRLSCVSCVSHLKPILRTKLLSYKLNLTTLSRVWLIDL